MAETISDPFFAALFGRTPKQRAEHTDRLLALQKTHPDMPIAEASHKADVDMEDAFYQELNNLAHDRALSYGIDIDHQPFHDDYNQLRRAALIGLKREIEALHQALPLPLLERSGPQ